MSNTPLLDRIIKAREEAAKEVARRAREVIEKNPAGTGLDAVTERKLEEAGLGRRGRDGKFELSISSGGESKG